jgi:acyl carrier protein
MTTFTADNVKSRVRAFIVDSWLNGDARGFDDSTDLQEAGVLDSFALLALIGFLEKDFSVQLEPGDINPEAFTNVDTIASLVIQKTMR